MLQGLIGRFTRTLRANEAEAFDRWFKALNAQRTKIVGLVLVVFGFLSIGLASLDRLDDPVSLFVGLTGGLLLGLWLIEAGQRRGQRTLCYPGELVVLATAISWMYLSVASRADIAFGLPEFIIGTLGLAMLRYMKPLQSIVVFSGFSLAYAGTLGWMGVFELEAWINASLFCCFAVIWSWSSYNSKVIEYRNKLLVDQLHRKNHQLSALALQDALTGLPNRRYFDQVLEAHWANPSRRHEPVALILADIDHFKTYNDRYGHPQGDECLQRVAHTLTHSLRSDGECMRLGGEEFAITVFGAKLDEGVAIAQRLAQEVRVNCEVTLSFGVASMQPGQGSLLQLYSGSDLALYKAKRNGRDRVESANMDAMAQVQSLPELSGAGVDADIERRAGEQ